MGAGDRSGHPQPTCGWAAASITGKCLLIHRGPLRRRAGSTLGAMTRLTIEVPDEVAERVAQAAAREGVAPEDLAGQAVIESFPPRRTLSFIGIGASGDDGGDIARRHKEIRRAHFAAKTASDV
jgi:hypothetical protein